MLFVLLFTAVVIISPSQSQTADDVCKHLSLLLSVLYANLSIVLLVAVVLGFEHGTYNTREGSVSVEVCVQVKGGVFPSRLSLRLSLTTMDGDATGEYSSVMS